MTIVAVEQWQSPAHRLIDDHQAARLLPAPARMAVGLCRWRFVRELMTSAAEKHDPGIWGSVACRKRYIDEKVREALARGVDAVVFLGAGLDTRGISLVAPAGVPAFEVDLPDNIAYKRKKLPRGTSGLVTLVPADLATDDLAQALAAHGFRLGGKTMFVWEAVTQYLTEDGFRHTMAFLSKAGTGSELVFTYIGQDFIDGTRLYGSANLYRRFRGENPLWHFGIAPEDVAGLLAEYNWQEIGQAGRTEFLDQYVRPAGRAVDVSGIERAVYATKA
jgi:methyltransferase (TIGR00027 family)